MYIDIHNHVAWDIDDGIQSKEDAEKLLQAAAKDGIDAIITTPHFIPGLHKASDVEIMTKRMEELHDLAIEYNIQTYQGCELFLNSDYLQMVEDQLIVTLNKTKYLLIEFDVRKDIIYDDSADDKLYELIIRGYIPIIAHAERYFHSILDTNRIRSWISMGCKIQVNRTSFYGNHGDVCKSNAFRLIDEGLVHFIATDAHSCKSTRICKLSDIHRLLKKEVGLNNADLLCCINPNAVINNYDIQEMEMIQRNRLLKIFKKR